MRCKRRSCPTWAASSAGRSVANRRPHRRPAPPCSIESFIAPARTLDRHAFHHWLIEAEIVFRFGRDLPSAGRPYDRQAVVDAIDQVCAGFEIVDSRFAAWPDVSAPLILADFASHGAMVIGSGTAPPAALSFGEAPVRLVIDDAVIVDRQGGNPAGDIVELAVWLANHLAETGAGLRAGDYVTTGSYTGMAPVPPGKAAEAHFATIGSVSVNRA